MMKNILTALLLSLTILGCGKNGQPDEDKTDPNKKQKVTLTIADLVAGSGDTNAAYADTAKKLANFVIYRLYKADGTYVKTASQTYWFNNFGIITDSLSAGTYKVFMSASMGNLVLSDSTVNYSQAEFGVFSGLVNTWKDSFSKAFTLTVGRTDVNQTVKLERCVAAFEVVIEDIAPPEVTSLQVTVTPAVKSLTLDGAVKNVSESGSHYYSYRIDAADRYTKGKKLTGFFAPGTSPAQVTITASNGNGNQVASNVIKNVTFEKNKKTIITGAVLPGTPTQEFKVVVDPSWGGNNNVKF
jgi:predicted small lipoprotein YifL